MKESKLNQIRLTSFCVACKQYILNLPTNRQSQALLIDNVLTSYRASIRSGAEFEFQGASFSVVHNFTENMVTDGVFCEVEEELESGPKIGSTRLFDIVQAHNLILQLLRNL